MNRTWSTNDNLGTLLESLHIILDGGTTNAGVALNINEDTDSNDELLDLLGQFTGRGENQSLALLDVWIELLEDRDRESRGRSGTRLSLGNDIVALKSVSYCQMLGTCHSYL